MSIACAIATGLELRSSRRSLGTTLPGPNLPDAESALEMRFLTILSQATVEGWGATSVLADPNSVLPLSMPAGLPGTTDPDVEGFDSSVTLAWLLLDSGMGTTGEGCTSVLSPLLGC